MCPSMVQCVKRLTLEDREKDRKREQEKDAADRLAEKEEAKNLKGLLRLDEILLMVQKSCQPVKIRCLSMFISLLYLHFYILPGAGCCCINYYMIETNVYVVFLDVLDWHDIRMLPYYTFWLFPVFWMQSLPTFLGCSKYIRLGKRDVFVSPPYLGVVGLLKTTIFWWMWQAEEAKRKKKDMTKATDVLVTPVLRNFSKSVFIQLHIRT